MQIVYHQRRIWWKVSLYLQLNLADSPSSFYPFTNTICTEISKLVKRLHGKDDEILAILSSFRLHKSNYILFFEFPNMLKQVL